LVAELIEAKEVGLHVESGASNAEVATSPFMSEATVKAHVCQACSPN
jgi:DNA-binding NarL/FixJ family response regulator